MSPAAASVAALNVCSVTCTPVDEPLRYVLGTSAATVRAQWDHAAVERFRIQ